MAITRGQLTVVGPESAVELLFQYSIDGSSNWHTVFAEGDLYFRVSSDGGVSWSDPARFAGPSGVSTYVHLAYANSADGSVGFSTSISTGKTYLGQFVSTSPTPSQVYSDYKWQKFVGEDGKGIVSATVGYQLHTSGTTPPTGTWLTDPPTPIQGRYSWTRTITTYTSGDPVTTYSVAYLATNGQNGVDGKGITSTLIEYAQTLSGTTTPSSWSTTRPSPIKGQYLWTKTTISYSDSTNSVSYNISYSATDGQKGDKGDKGDQGIQGIPGNDGQSQWTHLRYSVASNGNPMTTSPTSDTKYIGIAVTTSSTAPTGYASYTWQKFVGDDGKGVTSTVVEYANHTNGTTAPTTGWQATPAPVKGQYLWTRTTTTYTDGSTIPTYSVAYQATDGQAGKGISSTVVEYAQTASGTTTPTSWSGTRPAPIKGQYLWSKTTITYTDSTTSVAYSTSYSATDGQKGDKGDQGIPGTPGEDGQQYWTWIKYADSPTTGMDDLPTGKSYIGIAHNKTTPTESSVYSDYTWSLIKGEKGDTGPQGATGERGPKGDTGVGVENIVEYYLATSASSGVTTSTSGWTTTIQTMTPTNKYLWNYEVVHFTDGSNAPTVPVIIGVYGATGATGRALTGVTEYYLASASASGVSRPATDGTNGWTTTPQVTTPTLPYLWNYEKLTWSVAPTTTYIEPIIIGIHGAKGDQGIQGPPGANGQSQWTHIRYSTASNGNPMVSTPTATTKYIGIAVTTSSTAPTGYASYTWQKFVGEDGDDGKGITSTAITYANHTNGTTAPTTGWQETPAPIKGQYLWTRTITTYTDGSTIPTYSVAYQATDGQAGKGISSTLVEYAQTASGTTTPTSWSGTRPSPVKGQYLWSKTTITYTDGSSSVAYNTSYSATDGQKGDPGEQGIPGEKGADGIQYYTWIKYADSPTTGMNDLPTGKAYIGIAHNKTSPTESSVYTDYTWSLIKGDKGDTGATGATGAQGPRGENGTSVTGIVEHYLATPLATGVTKATSGWTTTIQSMTSTNRYLWNYETIQFSAGSPQDTIPVIIGVYGDTGRALTSITEYYLASASSTGVTRPATDGTGGWTTTPQVTTPELPYLWNYEKLAWNAAPTTSYIEPIVIAIHGAKGDQGIPGSPGKNSTVHIRYSVASNGVPMVATPTASTRYIGLAVTSSVTAPVAPTDPGAYTWQKFVGEDGGQGIQGPPGANGQPTYTWIKYADDATGAGIADTPAGKDYIGIAHNKLTATESNNPGDYTWSLIKGAPGRSITAVDVHYAKHTSATVAPTTGWSTTAPTWENGKYIWSKTVTTYSTGLPTESTPVCITGQAGGTGATGRGVSSIVEQFYLSTSKTSQVGGSWSTTMPTWEPGKYVWTRSLITYTSGTPATSTTEPLVSSEWEAATDALEEAKDYVNSRGQNLVTNGTGLLGNNTNFSAFAFDGTDAYGAAGSFKESAYNCTRFTDELMPVNPDMTYRLSMYFKENPVVGAKHYAMVVCFDIDKLSIMADHIMYIPGTLTTLAAELKPGDTKVYLTSVANYKNAASDSTYQRRFIFWDYKNSYGYQYPSQTYSRNVSAPDLWAPGSVNTTDNTITLRAPWTGKVVPVGTKVSNGASGSTYNYVGLVNNIGTADWTYYSGVIGTLDYSGNNSTSKFRQGTAYVKIGWLLNREVTGGTAWISNVSFGLNVETEEGAQAKAEAAVPAWVKDWSGTATKIGENYVLSPYIFSGQVDINGLATGVSIGMDLTPGAQQPASDIYGYSLGEITYRLTGNTFEMIGLNDSSAGLSTADTTGQGVRFWAGASHQDRNIAPFQVLEDGTLIADKAIIKGTVTITSPSDSNIVTKETLGSFAYETANLLDETFNEYEKIKLKETIPYRLSSIRIGESVYLKPGDQIVFNSVLFPPFPSGLKVGLAFVSEAEDGEEVTDFVYGTITTSTSEPGAYNARATAIIPPNALYVYPFYVFGDTSAPMVWPEDTGGRNILKADSGVRRYGYGFATEYECQDYLINGEEYTLAIKLTPDMLAETINLGLPSSSMLGYTINIPGGITSATTFLLNFTASGIAPGWPSPGDKKILVSVADGTGAFTYGDVEWIQIWKGNFSLEEMSVWEGPSVVLPGILAPLSHKEQIVVRGEEVPAWRPSFNSLSRVIDDRRFVMSYVNGLYSQAVVRSELTPLQNQLQNLMNDAITADQIDGRIESVIAVMQTDDAWGLISLREEVEANTGGVSIILETMKYEDYTVTIGGQNVVKKALVFRNQEIDSSSSDFQDNSLAITHNALIFRTGSTDVAWISNSTLYIESATIVNSLQVGNHVIESWGTDGIYTVMRAK